MGSTSEHGDFGRTSWSLIGELRSEDPERRRAAMNTLVETYQGPVYAYLRRLGCDPEKAADLTQAFFVDKVLDGGLFETADPHRARLRIFLCVALKNFRIDAHRRSTSGIDRNTVPLVRIEREEPLIASGPRLTPEDAFDRRWASAVVKEALDRCRRHFITRGRRKQWEAFYARTLRPILSGAQPPAQAAIAEEVGLETPGQVAQAVLQASRRMQIVLLEVVAETVTAPETAREEFAELMRLLRA